MINLKFQKNRKVVEAFDDVPWYILPLERQKDIAHIINRAQNGAVLTIGPLAALDYETATNVGTNNREGLPQSTQNVFSDIIANLFSHFRTLSLSFQLTSTIYRILMLCMRFVK